MKDVTANHARSSVVPVIRYRNLPAAIDWLCQAFGFEKQRITADSAGTVIFGQLVFGTAMIMVGPVRHSAFDNLLKQPDEIGGAETQVCYFFVPDAHTHCARAKAAGAEILFDIADRRNGGRSYSCRDPEGHLWNFGTYDPWRAQQLSGDTSDADPKSRRRGVLRPALAAVVLLAAGGVVTAASGILGEHPGWFPRKLQLFTMSTSSQNGEPTPVDELKSEREAKKAAQRVVKQVQERLKQAEQQLAEVERGKQAAEQDAKELREQLAKAINQRDAAELVAKTDREQLLKTWLNKAAAERQLRDARRQLARERMPKEASPFKIETKP